MPNQLLGSSASTITPTSTTSPKFVGDSASINSELSLNNYTVDGITHSTDTNDPKKLLTALGGGLLGNALKQLVDDLTTKVNNLKMSPVLTDPILSPNFIGENWNLYGWYLDNGRAIFINKGTEISNENSLKIMTEAFTKHGTYFIYLEIEKIDSGSLILRNEENKIIETFTLPGKYELEISITDQSIAFLEFIAKNVTKNQSIIIKYINICYIKSAFEVYMEYMAEKMASGGSSFVSKEQLTEAIDNALKQMQDYVNSALGASLEGFQEHIRDTNNPHGITPDKIGAAHAVHTHTQYLTETQVRAVLQEHINDKNNPHGTTAEQVGAAPKDHTHTPESIGAADREHTHEIMDINGLQEILDAINNSSDNLTALQNQLSEHILNNDNPHSTTKDQVGLGNVINGGMATSQEAIDGVLTDRYMNPNNTKTLLDYYANAEEPYLVQTLTPRLIAGGEFLKSSSNSIVIPIYENHIYQLKLSFSTIPGNTNITFGTEVVITDDSADTSLIDDPKLIMGSAIIAPSAIDVGGEFGEVPLMRVRRNMEGLTFNNISAENSSGVLTIDTTNMTICGNITQAEQVTENSDDGTQTIQCRVTPLQVYGKAIIINESYTKILKIKNLIINLACDSITLQLYELVATNQDPAMVIDAFPVGHIVSRYGKATVPGYSLIDGSELLKIQHQKLFDYANNNNLLIDVSTYKEEIADQGYTNHFGYDEGSTTFYIPKDDTTNNLNNLYRYMKIDDIFVPSNKQILYRYLWS